MTPTQTVDDHPLADVETLVVDPDDIVEALRFNSRPPERKNRRTAVIRVSPPFEAETPASIHHSEEGTFYPPEMSPKPVHIDPRLFVGGTGRQLPGAVRNRQTRSQHRSTAADDRGEAPKDVPEDVVDEYHETAEEVWEQEVRRGLRDEIMLRGQHSTDTSVFVRYTDNDD